MKYTLRVVFVFALVLIGLAALLLGIRMARADITAEVYRERLQVLAEEYESLRFRYNDAVRRAAVTELVVADGSLSVRVRSATGVIHEMPTPYDPSGEIYVDYVVTDGRLWIRRVFDAQTPPAAGLVLDPDFGDVDWGGSAGGTGGTGEVSYGKAIYRSLEEGRWVVTVTGSGSLGLRRVDHESDVDLANAPAVVQFDEIQAELDARVAMIGARDIWGRLLGW